MVAFLKGRVYFSGCHGHVKQMTEKALKMQRRCSVRECEAGDVFTGRGGGREWGHDLIEL